MHEIGCRFFYYYFLSRAFFAGLSAASFPRIPTCPGTDIKTISFWSALILCNSSFICISRGWSVLNFLSACKADSESEKKKKKTHTKKHEFPFLRLIGLFKSKQNCLQLRCVNRTVVSQLTWERAICGKKWHCCSSNLLIHFWAVGKYLDIILMSGCYFEKVLFVHFGVCGGFLCVSKIDRSEVQIDSKRGIWHRGVINRIQVNLWIFKQR